MTRQQKAVIRNATLENPTAEVKAVDQSEFGGPVHLWIVEVIGSVRETRHFTVGPRGGVSRQAS